MATWYEHYETVETGELESDLESLHSYFDSCSEIGQGFSTKDVVQERALLLELWKRGIKRHFWKEWELGN